MGATRQMDLVQKEQGTMSRAATATSSSHGLVIVAPLSRNGLIPRTGGELCIAVSVANFVGYPAASTNNRVQPNASGIDL
jgi:hypothetical protein